MSERKNIFLNNLRLGLATQRDLADLSLPELQGFSGLITDDVFGYLTLEGSVAARKHIGGTAPDMVRLAIQAARQHITSV